MTVRDLIATAFRRLGIVARGQPMSADDAAIGLNCLNAMLDAWGLDGLMVYVIDRQTFALVSNTQSYTLGPGGTWNTTPLYGAGCPRPVQIEEAYWIDPGTLQELPVSVFEEASYQSQQVVGVTGQQVLELNYTPSFPLGTVYVWPRPTTVATMVLYLWKPFNTANALTDTVSFPQGYQIALEDNLTVELSKEFPGSLEANPAIVAGAIANKANLKVANVRVPLLVSDAANITGRAGAGGSYYDFLAGRA